jgi:hypothetical protein
MKRTEKTDAVIAYAVLVAMKPADLANRAKSIVKLQTAVTTAETDFTESLHTSGKVCAAMKTQYTQRVENRDIPGDTSFKDYWDQNAGGKLPGRVEALAGLFNALVLTLDANGKPLLAEENYDAAAIDWLEKANAIVNAARKKHGDAWKTCDDVLDVVNALSKPGDALKTLKEVRKRQKGEKLETAEGEAAPDVVPLTTERCLAFLRAAIGTATAETGRELFVATLELASAWNSSNVPTATLNTWAKEVREAKAAGAASHMKIKTPTLQAA